MNDHQVQAAIHDLELRLRQDDPEMVRRFHATQRAEFVATVTVMFLLAAGAVLLTVGIATTSAVAWVLGLAALFASIAVDSRHKRSTAA
jgi:Protein of unknown function (DUF3040)